MAKSLAEQMEEMPPPGADVHMGDRIEQDLTPGKKGTVVEVSTDPLTVDKVLDDAGIDRTEWAVERMQPNQWQGFAKLPPESDAFGKGKWRIQIVTLYQMKIWLKPLQNRWALDALDLIEKRLANHKPNYPKLPTKTKGDWLAVAGLYDVHFGKLAWKGETHDTCDLKSTSKIYRRAVSQLLAAASPYRIARWEVPVGQDFLHIANSGNKTERGTEQDVDTRYPKIVAAAEGELIRAIDQFGLIAPVRASYTASNHDRHASWHIARTLKAHYRTVPSVEVDTDWHYRKYIGWGKNLIGVTHGDKVKAQRLTTLMPQEQPEAFAKAVCREWLTGHIHHEKVVMVKEAEEQEGVSVRTLRSLSGTDAFHYEHGYVSDRAAELHLYHRDGLQQVRFVFRVPKKA